jgi:hypothetical protein
MNILVSIVASHKKKKKKFLLSLLSQEISSQWVQLSWVRENTLYKTVIEIKFIFMIFILLIISTSLREQKAAVQ